MIQLIFALQLLSSSFQITWALSVTDGDHNQFLKGETPNAAQEEWISLSERVAFQPSKTSSNTESDAMLRRSQSRLLSEYTFSSVDGSETLYDDYAQAWRLLGLYVDCSTQVESEDRRLEEDNEDEAEEEGEEDEDEDEGCKRYMLWAAVSLNLKG
jgi:hypothetical protein